MQWGTCRMGCVGVLSILSYRCGHARSAIIALGPLRSALTPANGAGLSTLPPCFASAPSPSACFHPRPCRLARPTPLAAGGDCRARTSTDLLALRAGIAKPAKASEMGEGCPRCPPHVIYRMLEPRIVCILLAVAKLLHEACGSIADLQWDRREGRGLCQGSGLGGKLCRFSTDPALVGRPRFTLL